MKMPHKSTWRKIIWSFF